MNNSRSMRGGERAGCFDRNFEYLGQSHSRVNALAQSLSVNEFCGDETSRAARSNLMDREDVRMI